MDEMSDLGHSIMRNFVVYKGDSFIRVVQYRTLQWAGYVTNLLETRNATAEHLGKCPFGRSRRGGEIRIRWYIAKLSCKNGR
jgi:hypothetical protein